MQACQDGDVEFVKILAYAEGVKIDHQSKVMVMYLRDMQYPRNFLSRSPCIVVAGLFASLIQV